MSNMSNATTGILLQVGTFGGQFVGTVWFDDIRIQ
jgi:hypothetical protein